MDDQSSLDDFGTSELQETELYECEICGREFDSAKGRGIHRAKAHDEEEIKQVLITELHRLADELGRTPKQTDMTQNGAHSTKTYQKKFGSWNEALKQAGLEVNEEQNITKSDLRDELERLADELGRTPTSRDIAEDGKYGVPTYVNKFDSWNDALEAAGFTPRTTNQRISDQQLKETLQKLATDVGRRPTTSDMKEHGPYSPGVYFNRFGSWDSALREAGVISDDA